MKKIAVTASALFFCTLAMADKYGVDEALADTATGGGIHGAVFLIVGAVAGLICAEAKGLQTGPCVAAGAASGLVLGWLALALL